MTTQPLKPCPCGQVPASLLRYYDSFNARHEVRGSCCGAWAIQFNLPAAHFGLDSLIARADAAWNAAPRAMKTRAELAEEIKDLCMGDYERAVIDLEHNPGAYFSEDVRETRSKLFDLVDQLAATPQQSDRNSPHLKNCAEYLQIALNNLQIGLRDDDEEEPERVSFRELYIARSYLEQSLRGMMDALGKDFKNAYNAPLIDAASKET